MPDNQDQVDAFFAADSDFVADSTNLLEDIFDVIIDAQAVSDNKNDDTDFTTYYTIILVPSFFIFCCCCCIICYYGYKNERMRAKVFKKAIHIRNPMVIPIAIGFYETKPKKPEINAYLKDLDEGVRRDIDNIRNLFDQELNYDIYPHYEDDDINTYKASWKKVELVQFLREKADDLEDNLTDENAKKIYDGLIVFVSCHGMEQHIITSDYKKLSKTKLHRIFRLPYVICLHFIKL